jgi:hypothetical protein
MHLESKQRTPLTTSTIKNEWALANCPKKLRAMARANRVGDLARRKTQLAVVDFFGAWGLA